MQPKLAILISVIVAVHYTAAAPKAYNDDILPRPSPINPDIPMDPKPAETITLITDPKEIAKFKREIGAEATTFEITAPTTVPPAHPHPLHEPEQEEAKHKLEHHREKRDSTTKGTSIAPQTQQKSTLDSPAKRADTPLSDKQTAAAIPSTPAPPKRRRDRSTTTTTTQAPTRRSTTAAYPIKPRQKRDNEEYAVPLIYRDQHKQPISTDREQHSVEAGESVESHEPTQNVEQQSTIQPQTLPFFFSEPETSDQSHKESKRDIPVPLVPKYHHPEETPDEGDDQNTKSESKETERSSTNKPAEHATTLEHHSSESSVEKEHQKRTATENSDVVQVEDLSEYSSPKPTQQSQQSQQQATSSTTVPSIFRHHPVPVAELFAKAKTTETPERANREAN